MDHRILAPEHPEAMFHRESNRHTGFLSVETRDCVRVKFIGRLRSVCVPGDALEGCTSVSRPLSTVWRFFQDPLPRLYYSEGLEGPSPYPPAL